MPSRSPGESQPGRGKIDRVAAPPSQAKVKAKRLSPVYALAWLHLMPKSAFPIRSHEDMAAKISALLLQDTTAVLQEAGHGLPTGQQLRTPKQPDPR